jgi:Mlc titration factor MtfA (ptsG expression regulator)
MKFLAIFILILIIIFFAKQYKRKQYIPGPFSDAWRKILLQKVHYYSELSHEERILFEKRIQRFLFTTKITGIDTSIDDNTRLLVASSAIIPVFAFPKWEYKNLYEVLIYPASFNENYKTNTQDSTILGMVGTGTMEGKMILSKPALIHGFSNHRDKRNVGIHEFVHLIDKTDGIIDGIPSSLVNKEFCLPWLNHIRLNIDQIRELKSDINSYGGVSKEEFFSVISEYFFERPKLLQSKHPELYHLLKKIFTMDLAKKYKNFADKKAPGRNDPCSCGSGKKYKHCCLKS